MYKYKCDFDVITGIVAEPGESYRAGTAQQQWIEVLVDCPGAQGLFTYRLPAGLEIQPGDILTVPFGSQSLGAIAVRFVDHLPADLTPDQIREVEDVVSTGFFPITYWQLLEQVANYYYTPLIQVIRAALPPGLLGRAQRRIRLSRTQLPNPSATEAFLSPVARQILELLQASKTGDYTWQYIQRQIRGANRGLRELLKRGWVESYLEPPTQAKPKQQQAVTLVTETFPTDLTARQREVLEVLRRRGGELSVTELLQTCSTSSSTIKKLEEKGCVVIQLREVLRIPVEPAQPADQPKELTDHQRCAVEAIAGINGFAQVLLHGVTGSGKTEVYLQAIAPVLQRGESALVLVPEIGLTPQLTDRFRARFGQKVCVYHSALSDGERYDTWRQMLTGTPQVVIGTRSAIFAPLPQIGLIVLDEEYDSSFKQDQPAPTYHARTVAQWRAELTNCPLILGSATPALETWIEVKGKEGENAPCPMPHSPSPTHYLSLPERVHSRPMPPVEVVDMRLELRAGNRSIFSRSLQDALSRLQATGEQGILFIHRRGHSTFVSCRSCGYVIECPNCDVSLSYHYTHEGAAEVLRCHYCNYGQLHPERCPECSSPYLKNFGSGTQRVEEELGKQFPQLRVIRFDSDTTRTKGAHRNLLTRFANREADLLVGTQMLTKGLDLPQVTLVGVVAADGLLNLADFRAAERAVQTLMQVAGRAGRGDDPGRVIVQTYSPEHPALTAVRRHDYEQFIAAELEQRAALNYPPYGRLILLRLSGADEAEVEATAERLVSVLQPASEVPVFEILGPAPAPIMRVANRYRWHILLKFPLDLPFDLPAFESLRAVCPGSVSLTIDVDPLNLG
ncbi:primosomal protein N' [Microcoleus sp. FACHB-68]|uniref:primosomal protein N' n=1 Tax=Microcoleus sp. FACHB-68 TaxID=2692826 RepID=UPI0016821EC0|nr:primosomal protein N' [Microcoleus sp. FACHB-68]MBD1940229.1 primosomal protein N' [Microcoleus sp. FACHB-68]